MVSDGWEGESSVALPRVLKLNAIEGKGRTKGKTKAEEKRRGEGEFRTD